MGETPPKPLNVLSLDAGGPKALSQLYVLNEIMSRMTYDQDDGSTEKRPCEVFDMIGGVDTGGFIAILLVVLKLTAMEAGEEFITFISDVFMNINPEPKRQSERLKVAVMELLQRHNIDPDTKLVVAQGQPPACRLAIFITYDVHAGSSCVVRNYMGRNRPMDITVAEALMATCAISPIFDPVKVGKRHRMVDCASGGVSFSNPVRKLLNEAREQFGDHWTISTLLSLGCGHPAVNTNPQTPALIAILERIAVESEKTAREIEVQMADHTMYHRFSVIQGLQYSGFQSLPYPEWISTHTMDYLNSHEIDKGLDRYVETVKLGVGYATLEQLTRSGGALVSASSSPQAPAHYISREGPMESIKRFLLETNGTLKAGAKIVVVTGIGGCGKTQLVRRFVEEFGNLFLSAFFVDGSSKDTIRNGITRYVRSLGTSHSQKSFYDSMQFLSKSDGAGQRLMIIDNLDDGSLELPPFLPRWTDGVVMITSRSAARGQISPSTHLTLDVMSPGEAVELLARGMNVWPLDEATKPAYNRLARELRYYPIAIVQAISYMWQSKMSAETFTSRLNDFRTELTRDHDARNQIHNMEYLTAFAVFSASYEIMEPSAQKFCHVLSFFHRQKFPLRLVMLAVQSGFANVAYKYMEEGDGFRRGKALLEDTFCSSGPLDQLGLDNIVKQLGSHSFVTLVEADGQQLLEMHQLVHDWGRLHISRDEERFRDAAVRLLCCGAIENNQPMMQYLFSHVQQLKDIWKTLHVNDAASFSFILDESGLQAEAVELLEIINGALEVQLGQGHKNTIRSMRSLAGCYERMGRRTEARILKQKEEVRSNVEMFGENDPITIAAEAALQITMRQLRRETTRTMMVDSEPRSPIQQILGPTIHDSPRPTLLSLEHPDQSARSPPNEASLMTGSSGHRGEETHATDPAVMHELEIIKITERTYGPSNPVTVSARENLARKYTELGRYAEAEQMMKNVRTQRRDSLGEGHLQTINAASLLAAIYDKMGNYAEAERLARQVLMQREEKLGEDSRETFSARFHYAIILYKLQRYTEAEAVVQRALEISRDKLGTTSELYTYSSSLLTQIRQRPILTLMT